AAASIILGIAAEAAEAGDIDRPGIHRRRGATIGAFVDRAGDGDGEIIAGGVNGGKFSAGCGGTAWNEGGDIKVAAPGKTVGRQWRHPSNVPIKICPRRVTYIGIPSVRTAGGIGDISAAAGRGVQILVYRVTSEIRSRTRKNNRDGLRKCSPEIRVWLRQHSLGKGIGADGRR